MPEYVDKVALLEEIQKCACIPCETTGEDYNGVRCAACAWNDAIELVENMPVSSPTQFPQWVKVSDELPEESTDVLVYVVNTAQDESADSETGNHGEVYSAWYINEVWVLPCNKGYWYIGEGKMAPVRSNFRVMYWMPQAPSPEPREAGAFNPKNGEVLFVSRLYTESAVIYAFNSEGVLEKRVLSTEQQLHEYGHALRRDDEVRKWLTECAIRVSGFVDNGTGGNFIGGRRYIHLVCENCEGMTKRQILEHVKSNPFAYPSSFPNWECLVPGFVNVCGIERPIYERYEGNTNSKVFDYIEVVFLMTSSTTKDDVDRHIRILWRTALDKIRADKRFQKYGVPIRFIKPSDGVFTKDKRVVLQFVLKNEQPLDDEQSAKDGKSGKSAQKS